MVANGHAAKPYSGTTPLSLRVGVSSSAQWNFPYVTVNLSLWGAMQTVSGGKTETDPVSSGESLTLFNASEHTAALLVWTGDSFAADSGQVTYPDSAAQAQVTEQLAVSGSVDTQHSRLVTITFKRRLYWDKLAANPDCTVYMREIVQQVTITNAPLLSDCPYSFVCFGLTGTAAAANTQLVYTDTWKATCTGWGLDSQSKWVPGTIPASASATVQFQR